MRPVSPRRAARISRQVSSVFANVCVFHVFSQTETNTWDGSSYYATSEEARTVTEYYVPCRIQHGTDGIIIRSYRDVAQVGEVGDVWVQIKVQDTWIAESTRDSEGSFMVVDGIPAQVIEVTPNRVGLITSTLVKGRYKPDG